MAKIISPTLPTPSNSCGWFNPFPRPRPTFVLPATMARPTKGGGLAETPGTSIPELAQHLGKSDRAIERAIRKLRADGKLARIGPAKGGHWEVFNEISLQPTYNMHK